MRTKTIIFLTFICVTIIPLIGCADLTNGLGSATVTVKIVDDIDKPLEDVRSEVYNLSDFDVAHGLTDTNGKYSLHLDNIEEIKGRFRKTGYYETKGVIWEGDEWGDVPPANTNFIVVMKRIVDPVPMKYRNVEMEFPRLGEFVGFDFEVGDWVFPDGKGKISDIMLSAEGRYEERKEFDFKMEAKFTGELNGLQSFYYPHLGQPSVPLRSELPPPALAPLSGYDDSFECFVRSFKAINWSYATSFDENKLQIFRVRTVVDEKGEIVSANYGWMTRDVYPWHNKGKGCIKFRYYYNPDPHSRSLEPKEIADRQNRD